MNIIISAHVHAMANPCENYWVKDPGEEGGWWCVDHILQFDCWPELVKQIAAEQGWDADAIVTDLKDAVELFGSEIARAAHQGACGPLWDWLRKHGDDIDAATVRALIRGDEESRRIGNATRDAKRRAMAQRRREYQIARPDLVLALIDAGKPYICASDSCLAIDNLTIDHIKPLSRGGTDDPANLQFLCRSCNSSKGDKPEPVRRAAE